MAGKTKYRVQKSITKPSDTSSEVKKRVRTPNLKLDETTVTSACVALLKAHKQATSYENDENAKAPIRLVENVDRVSLQYQLAAPPQNPRLMPKHVELAHSMYNASHNVCLIVSDPAENVTRVLDKVGYGGVTKVLGLEEIKLSYKSHERRRALAHEFDLFLVDSRVRASMPRHLGVWFQKSKKMPISVNLNRALPEALQRAISSTAVQIPKGVTATVHVGTTEMSAEKIAANIKNVASRCAELMNSDVEALYLRSHRTKSLPLYLRLPCQLAEDPVVEKVDELDEIIAKFEKEEVVN